MDCQSRRKDAIHTPINASFAALNVLKLEDRRAKGTDAEAVIPIKLSNPVMSMASWTKRQGEVTSHSRSYGEELQRSIFIQIASTIGDLESVIGIISIASWKRRKFNQHLMCRVFDNLGFSMNDEKIMNTYQRFRDYGAIVS